jgi:hypothetical protein
MKRTRTKHNATFKDAMGRAARTRHHRRWIQPTGCSMPQPNDLSTSLAALDADDRPGAVDVLDFERDDLGGAQPGPTGDTQCRPVPETGAGSIRWATSSGLNTIGNVRGSRMKGNRATTRALAIAARLFAARPRSALGRRFLDALGDVAALRHHRRLSVDAGLHAKAIDEDIH